jgi:hypothetical protein
MNEYIHQGEMHMACPSRGTRGSGGGATVTHCNTPYTPLFAVTQRPNPGSPIAVHKLINAVAEWRVRSFAALPVSVHTRVHCQARGRVAVATTTDFSPMQLPAALACALVVATGTSGLCVDEIVDPAKLARCRLV